MDRKITDLPLCYLYLKKIELACHLISSQKMDQNYLQNCYLCHGSTKQIELSCLNTSRLRYLK